MSSCIYCHQQVKSGGDRHAKGSCPSRKKEKEKIHEAQPGDLATARGQVVAGAGKTSNEKSRKGKSRGSGGGK